MTLVPIHHKAFSAGLVSPAFYGRSDTEAFDRALAWAMNFYIDYRGGVKNRPGTQYLDARSDADMRFWTFALGNYADDYLLIFSDKQMKVMQRGAYALDGDGDVMIYTTPWADTDLDQLRFAQEGLVLTVVHQNHAPREITFNPQTQEWAVTEVDFLYSMPRPTVSEVDASGSGTASFVIAVTAVDENGKESLPSRPWLVTNVVNFTTTAGSVTFQCTPVAGARSYRWYRSIVADGVNTVTIAQNLGFVGETHARVFTDSNILPDFSRAPPTALNPFAGGQVLAITVSNSGTGYNPNTTSIIRTDGPGTGLIAYPVIQNGEILGVTVLNWGSGHDGSSVLAVTGGGGSGGGVAITELSPSTKYPKLVSYFQQRRVFASTSYLPTGIWGSAVGDYSHFSTRIVPRDNESYQIYADVPGNDYIEHILPMNDSILLFHSYGIDRLRGGNGIAITANDHLIERQSSLGAGSVHPILVNNAVVYSSPRGDSIRAMAFNQNEGGFIPGELSMMVRELFNKNRRPKQIVWQPEPDRLLWVLTTNGELYTLTYVPEQEVFAWAMHYTNGKVLDIVCVREKLRDVIYLFVQRYVSGAKKYFIEMMADREVQHVEESWFLDAAVASATTDQEVELKIKYEFDTTGEVLSYFRAETSVDHFSFLHKDWHLRAMDGLYKITEFISQREVRGIIIDYPGTEYPYNEDEWYTVAASGWQLDKPKKVFSGLLHLRNQKVSALADGNVYQDMTVNNDGEITFPQPHSRVIVGLSYESEIWSLPLSSREVNIEGKKKRIVGVKLRFLNSRGMEAGTFKKTFPMRDTSFYQREENLQLRSGVEHISIGTTWEIDSHFVIKQKNPLPAEILGYVLDVEV